MPYGAGKNKLGDRGSIKGEKTFNEKSGVQSEGGPNSPQTEWQGKAKAPKSEGVEGDN